MDENGTIVPAPGGGEDCMALEDIAGTPVARSIPYGRGYLTAGVVLAVMIAYKDVCGTFLNNNLQACVIQFSSLTLVLTFQ